jgi:DNA (cytosine-5)-methyltransferase 3A
MAQGGGRGGKVGIYKVDLPNGDYIVRKLTNNEAERCQNLPDNYPAFGAFDNGVTKKISTTQRYRCIGNGWTVDVISHILSHTDFI